MTKYKVIALNATGVNGKVHYAKEVLTADQLGGSERAKSLVKQGFVEALKVDNKKELEAKKLADKELKEKLEAEEKLKAEADEKLEFEKLEAEEKALELEKELANRKVEPKK